MEIRPIRTDKDHLAVLAEIDTRREAPKGTDALARTGNYLTPARTHSRDDPQDPMDIMRIDSRDLPRQAEQ